MRASPSRSPSAVDVEIDQHRLVLASHDLRVRLLDPVGSLIWSFLDGTATVEALADDLSAVFAQPAEEVAATLLPFIDALARDGLLSGTEPAAISPTNSGPTVLSDPPSP